MLCLSGQPDAAPYIGILSRQLSAEIDAFVIQSDGSSSSTSLGTSLSNITSSVTARDNHASLVYVHSTQQQGQTIGIRLNGVDTDPDATLVEGIIASSIVGENVTCVRLENVGGNDVRGLHCDINLAGPRSLQAPNTVAFRQDTTGS